MKTKHWLSYWQLGLGGLLVSLGVSTFAYKALAQSTPSNIQPDDTLGTESSQIIQNFQGQAKEVIEGGATRGINLFHSFREFNVSEGREAYFLSPSADIQNILARVTGGNRSEILGILGTFQIINGNIAGSNANLFLINPNGIIFGQNASLDMQGSFVGTTANSVQFGNQGNFSTINSQAVPLLTVNPSALLFNQINQREIINRSRQITTPGSIYLIGGNITFDGGGAVSLGNRLELGAVAGIGTVELIGSGNQMQLAFPEGVLKADIVLQNNAFAFTSKGGAVSVNGGNLSLSGNSLISSILQTGEGQQGVAGEDIVVNTTGDVTLDDSNISSRGFENSLGDTGNVLINAQSIRLTNQSLIDSNGLRNRGNIILNAKDNVSLDSNSLITTSGIYDPIGKSGDITIATRNINLSNESGINSVNFGQGQGGKITLKAQEAISLTSGSNISSGSSASVFSQVNNQSGGDIEIKTKTLTLDGSNTSISSSNLDEGNSGNISIVADDSISLNGFALISSASYGQGAGGDIKLQTRSLTLTNGGNIGTQSSGSGNSGNLLVKASDSVSLSGITTFIDPETGKVIPVRSGLTTSSFGTGNAGDITVNAQTINLSNQGLITSSNIRGNAGNILLQAQDYFFAQKSLITSNIGSPQGQPAKGNVGNIEISARTVSLTDGAQLQASLYPGAEGNGGLISLKAKETISFAGTNSGIFTNVESGAVGNGSDIQISASSVSFTNDAGVYADNAGQGNSGKINITTGSFFLNNALIITSNIGQGNAGNILVQAQDNFFANDSLIISNIGSPQKQPAKGNVGNIEISARTVSLTDGAQLQAGLYPGAEGNGGLISLKAKETISFAGTNSGIFTNVKSGAVGNGSDIQISASSVSFTNDAGVYADNAGQGNSGKINITTGSFFLNNALITTSNIGQGNAGNILVQAQDNFFANNNSLITSNIGSPQKQPAKGNVGNIEISARTVFLTNGAQLQAGFYSGGQGNAGRVSVKAQDTISFAGTNSGIFTDVESGAVGNGSDIQIFARSVSFTDGAVLLASNAGQGNGGNIDINTQDLLVRDGAGVFVFSLGTGNAGIITINADGISLDNKASLNANTRSPNKDPNREQATINLNTQNLILRDGSNITTNATGENVIGGNININTKFLIALENSRISANSDNSRGGQVKINAQGVFVGTQPSDVSKYITATSGVGLSGTVNVNSPDNSVLQNSFTQLSQNFIDSNALIANSCIVRGNQKQQNSFTMTGRGGLPQRPGDVLVSNYATGSVRNVINSNQGVWKKGDPIVEPQGVYRTASGQIILSRECE